MSDKQNYDIKAKKYWQRAIFSLAMGALFGLFFYWMLSLHNPLETTGRRDQTINFMLQLLSPAGWGWGVLVLFVLASLLGELRAYKFRNLPDVTLSSEIEQE